MKLTKINYRSKRICLECKNVFLKVKIHSFADISLFFTIILYFAFFLEKGQKNEISARKDGARARMKRITCAVKKSTASLAEIHKKEPALPKENRLQFCIYFIICENPRYLRYQRSFETASFFIKRQFLPKIHIESDTKNDYNRAGNDISN